MIGRTVVLTGAAAGLGRAYAERVASLGASLVLCDMDPNVEAVAAELDSAHAGRIIAVIGSVADSELAERAVTAALTIGGRVDGLVNNAGIGLQKTFAESTVDDYRRLMDVHYFGTINLCKAVWPHMTAAAYGRIVNVVSTTLYGFSGWSAYGAAKGAIFGLSRTMAVEGEPLGISVNMIAPGAATPMLRANSPDERIAAMMEATMPAEKVAPTVAYLLSDQCEFTGRAFTSSAGQICALQLGVTAGVTTNGADEDEVAAAIADQRMTENFIEETSVLASLARRAAAL
jgi:NAD(P)-dependent dehydrogenase (short-subunit alcohol dehydrogenase family)